MTSVIVASSGTSGPRGNSVLNGSGAPSAGTGIDGDWYIDNSNVTALVIYGPKTAGAWGSGQALGAGGALLRTNNLSDLNSAPAARSNLGLGGAATQNVGTTAGTVASGDDSRLSNARTPTAHASTHASAGSDPVTPAAIGAYTTGAGAALDARVTTVENTALTKADNLASVANPATARTNLGLGNSATRAVGTTAGTVAAGDDSRFTAPDAWVFDVTAYGAVGNGKVVADAAMTASSAVLTSATASFTAGDVGKAIQVLGAGASGETLVGTISAYTSGTQVTLSATAGSTVSGACAMWASDDTAAIQAAIDAAAAYAVAHSGAATVRIPPAAGQFYGIAGALKTGGSTLGNSQLTLPVYATTGRKITLSIRGTSSGAGVQHWQQTVPNTTGATLLSFGIFASAGAQTASINAGGNPSVLGGPSQPGGYGVAPGVFSNLYVDIGNVSVLTAHSKFGLTYTAIDLSGVANARLQDVAYSTTGTVPGGSYVSPGVFATGLSIGCLLPANGNNDLTIVENVTCGGGYTYGIVVPEHTDIYGLRILYCWAALCPAGSYYSSVGAAHSIRASLVSIEQCTFLIYIFGPGTGGLGPTMDLRIDTETSIPRFGCRTSGTGLAAARGKVVIAGLFTPANLTLDYPTGLHIESAQLSYPVTTKTSNYTAISFDEDILADATSGAITITLPTAVGRTRPVTVKKIDASGNPVTIDGAGSETIDGQAVRQLFGQWDYATLGPSGSGWYVKAAPTAISWTDRPSEQGLLAWTYDPNMAGHVTAQSNAGVAGRITLVKIPIREQITWSAIWFGLAGVDAGASLSNCYLGVYDSAGNLKGTTADISSSLMSGATAKSVALTSSFTAAPGFYFIAMLLNGTWATNSLTFKASGAGVSVNAGLSAPNLRYSNLLTSQTSLPSSLTLSSQSTSIINTGWASQWYGVS
ncbi:MULTISPECIES: hypothetical protein [unclassified Streptomyces]|uniref:hypothetical protein n=1 Tax=unclassified Streptomyces TaxID=2593676 RepID=UPI0033193E21